MADKLKVKFMTVIWGARYIEEFASVSLPSYLAEGNLPYVASETDLEILIMTSTGSRDKFEEQPLVKKLKELCPIRYIFIDDLITTGNYGITLTLAYARGIMDSGAEQTNTNFVFMNSDFVLADGSLRTLVAKLQQGHHCIMAPSLRARSETTVPTLIEAVNRVDYTLSMPSRRMVQLAFDNLHPTVIGKTITQDFVTCSTHNQIYWQVDATTLLGRYHLIFMLAIKPEVPMGPVNSYCDYGFVPAMVPSGKFTIMDDSDEFFMLELQSSAQERDFLRCGISTPSQIAAELSIWTTREHRRFAEVDAVFRSGDLPAEVAAVRAEATRFIAALHGRMRSPPASHVDHFYWASGMQAWSSLKFPGATPVLPPEVIMFDEAKASAEDAGDASGQAGRQPAKRRFRRPHLSSVLAGLSRLLTRLYRNLLGHARRMTGVVPNVPVWNHLWLDSRLILNWIKSRKALAQERNLLVCDEASSLPISLPKLMPLDVRVGLQALVSNIADARQGKLPDPDTLFEALPQGHYDNLLVHVFRAELPKMRSVLECAERFVKPSGMIAIYIEHRNSEVDSSNFSRELAQYVEDLLPTDWIAFRLNTSFAGGRVKRQLRLSERYLFRYLWPSSLWRLPHLFFALAVWPVIAALTALNNFRLRNETSECPEYCSSALLRLTRLAARTAADAPGPEARLTAAPRLEATSSS